MISDAAAQYGDKPYLKYFGKNNDICELSYNGLEKKVTSLSTFLLANNGINRVAILSENRYEWIISYISAICSGKVVVPLDKELHFDQASAFMDLAKADAVIYSGKFDSEIKSIANKNISLFICLDGIELPDDSRFCIFDDCISKGDALIEAGSKTYARLRTNSAEMREILFTSGTTGTSKGVMLSEDNIMSCIHAASDLCSLTEDDVALSVLPFNHTYEATCGILTPICIGATVCLNNSLKYVIRNLKIFKPTVMVVVPLFVTKIYRKISDEITKSKKEKLVSGAVKVSNVTRKAGIDIRRAAFSTIHKALGGRLRTIICGGAALDSELVTKFDDLGITIVQGYGITECSPLVALNPYDKIKSASVGMPITDTTVRIVGTDEDGLDINLPANEIGEICVKGPQVMLGYYANDEATKDAFNNEGFFRTGDYGYIDNDGYVYITGRKKNIIILDNGKNVYPEEIEEYLGRCELINECVVVARKIGSEELITAVVFPDYSKFGDMSDEEIKAEIKKAIININKTLPIFKQIRNIEIKKTEFEKTTTKKIIRSKV